MTEVSTILVVDDEKVIRDGCTLILKPEGYQVVTAENGKVALEVLAAQPVNAVLCDLKMPVMGALEFLEEAREHYPGIPIIIITGHGTVDDAVECMKKGAYDFVTKPFRIDHLTLCVRRALEKERLERETQRLQAEQARNLYHLALEQSRLHTIINVMADGVLVVNRDLEVVLLNQAFRQFLGDNSIPPLPGPLQAYFPDDSLKEELLGLLGNPVPATETCVCQEFTLGHLHFRALSAPFHGPDHQVLGTVTVFHDITGFKELDRMKTEFVNMVSHELRSPLSAIKMQQEVILEGLAGDLTPKQREMLTRSQARIQGLVSLVSDLLDVAKIESGHRVMEQVPLDLGEVLTELVDMLKAKAASQNVALFLMLPEMLPPVLADRRGMEEVFTNLVSNAINYSPDGGDVQVTASSHGAHVEVQVADTGVGIPAEEIPKIFDKFYRVKSPKTRQVIGSGLGLAIVRTIVEMHRGLIKVESQEGAGTTFRISLPTVPEAWSAEHGSA